MYDALEAALALPCTAALGNAIIVQSGKPEGAALAPCNTTLVLRDERAGPHVCGARIVQMLHVSRNADDMGPRKWKRRSCCKAFCRWTMDSRSGGWWW